MYEDGGSLNTIRERVEMYMGRYVLCGMMLWNDVVDRCGLMWIDVD